MVVCNRYASSLFSIALEEGILDEVHTEILEISELFTTEKDLYSILSAPNINNDDKIAIITKLFKDKINTILFNFFAILIEKKRIDLFFEVKDEFIAIYNDEKNIIKAQAITAVPMTKTMSDIVLRKIKDNTGKNVDLECIVKPEILGGIILKYDNKLVDGSVKTRLLNLNKEIKEVGV